MEEISIQMKEEMEFISTHICKAGDIGVHGNLFGGIMLSWFDEAGGALACQYCDTPRMVTVKMSEALFKKPVRPGHLIKVYGEVIRIGTTSISLRLEARRHSPYNGSQVVAAECKLVFVRVDGDGEKIPISEKVQKKFESKKIPEKI